MHSGTEICEKITSMYPDIGTCGVGLSVDFEEGNSTWLVTMKKDGHELHHHLELHDAEECLEGKQCVSLGLEISQMMNNLRGEGF